jgi:hypothetical protein
MGWGCYLHAKHPNWKTRVITLDLSVTGDPASKYTTADTVLGIISPLKFHHSITALLTSVELSLYQRVVSLLGQVSRCSKEHIAWRYSPVAPAKRRYSPTTIHGVITQNTTLCNVLVVSLHTVP